MNNKLSRENKLSIAIWFGILGLLILTIVAVKYRETHKVPSVPVKPLEQPVYRPTINSSESAGEKLGSLGEELCSLDSVVCENEMMARITQYGWTGNRMANGEWPHIGAVATSDRTIPFGTRVLIGGEEYVVKDRTALWVSEKFNYSTFDIYSDDPKGLSYSNVIIK